MTDTLSQAINRLIDGKLVGLRTCFPGRVETYDQDTQNADVKPMLKRNYNGEIVEMPVIRSVRVIHPRAGEAFLKLPVKKGDTGLCICIDRSIDTWAKQGGVVDPESFRRHSPTDAVFLPGLFPENKSFTPQGAAEDLELSNGSYSVIIKPSGEVTLRYGGLTIEISDAGTLKIENATGDLVSLLSDLATQVSSITVATAIGVQPVLNKPAIEAIKAQIDTFKA